MLLHVIPPCRPLLIILGSLLSGCSLFLLQSLLLRTGLIYKRKIKSCDQWQQAASRGQHVWFCMIALDVIDGTEDTVRYRYKISICQAEKREKKRKKIFQKYLLMFPFSMALMSGLKRQSVGARIASMPGSSSFSDIAKFVKLYICGKANRAAKMYTYWNR